MKGIKYAIGVGLLSLPLLFGGCKDCNESSGNSNLKGKVVSEMYTPGSWNQHCSYFFTMDTEYGRKSIEATSIREPDKLGLATLIEPGDSVEIVGFNRCLDRQMFEIPIRKIRVLDN